jgi:hypothetical protein
LKRISISLSLSCLVLLSPLAATATTVPVFAHTQYYNTGYSQGQAKSTADYYYIDNGHNDYTPFCPTNDAWTQSHGAHTNNFCAGFVDGYNAQWTRLAPYFMQQHWNRVNNQQIDQNGNVNIKGNSNRVTVNQNVVNNVPRESSEYDDTGRSSGGHTSYQPSCTILCSIIKVN